MKKTVITFLLLVLVGLAFAKEKHKVTIILKEEIALDNDSVYIVGNFNKWDYDAGEEYRLKPVAGSAEKSITLELKAGEHSYQFHRGSKDKLEINLFGRNINRKVLVSKNDTVLTDTIEAWRDISPRIEVFTLSDSLINTEHTLYLSGINMWLYREGNDSTWAAKEVDTSGWKKLKPSDIKESFADENGRFEGWFRAKIKVDSSLFYVPLNLYYHGWQAADIYFDGKLIRSYGNTGANGEPYSGNKRAHTKANDLLVTVDNEHVLAIHFVDKLSKLPKHEFKGNFSVQIYDNARRTYWDNHLAEEPIYNVLRLVVGAFLSLLFWMLVFLNRGEKKFKIIAVFSTLLTFISFEMWMPHNPFASYNTAIIINELGNILAPLFLVFSILMFVIVFNRKITQPLLIILAAIFLIWLAEYLFTIPAVFTISTILLTLGTMVYYAISSRKTIRGAQWMIIVGFSSLVVLLIFAASYFPSHPANDRVQSIFLTVVFISFPLSLLVYIALRYKEVLSEVRRNASEVVRISEEKKELLASQNEMLENQVKERTAELSQSLENLKAAQTQLIQSEKMASLGELTAGIAHEIQNPLNFVNNFSELNSELIDELKEELAAGNNQSANEIANNIKDNEQKIIHHGKRAESIVRGMLLHSRGSTGQKEATDINALADEYLRLSYHGFRAKDKSFNADFKLEADKKLPKIEIVPQDIGRVLLNLINNAFYAVNEKVKQTKNSYKPSVVVQTTKTGNGIEIRVSDNGPGIPNNVREKIFQPFYTTKPTGQGTGLGLSLSYDIIKAHGGELNFISDSAAGTTFIITLNKV
ncbi:ATP-binding protein [Maribellus sediminis]|uniref:ATP-binding protein n=1 Tax=Maribellus sediminis TaxID=2696285 RepID=UPI0019821E22|nr:ATP-binding protein [Maribellus sediminis]